VPTFDLVAADVLGHAIPIQVKAINGPSWQFRANAFLNIEIVDGEQKVKGKVALPDPELVCIFVVIKTRGADEFYIFRLRDLQDHFALKYTGGRRPRNPQSLHCAVWPVELAPFRDNWGLVDSTLRHAAPT